MTETIRYAWGQSSLGKFLAAMSARGLVLMEFGDPGSAAVDALRTRFPVAEVIEDPAFMTETLKRLGEPEEIGEAVVWLCSDHASYVTGLPMPVDGGFMAQ